MTRWLAKRAIANPINVYLTQNPNWITKNLFYQAGFSRDSSGVYHSRPDAIQQLGGYNDFYDTVFYYSTSMDKAKFQFASEERDYIFWAWKGDYLNLGAGAELGIYSNQSGILGLIDVGTPNPNHWLVDTNLAMEMTLELQYKGDTIIKYNPTEKQWWITGFNPYYQGVNAADLTATYTVTFNNKSLYKDFLKSDDYLRNQSKWSIIDSEKYIMQLKF